MFDGMITPPFKSDLASASLAKAVSTISAKIQIWLPVKEHVYIRIIFAVFANAILNLKIHKRAFLVVFAILSYLNTVINVNYHTEVRFQS